MGEHHDITYPIAGPATASGLVATALVPITGLTKAKGNDIGLQMTTMTEDAPGDYTMNFDSTVAGATAADLGIIWDIIADSDQDPAAEWLAFDDPAAWEFQLVVEVLSMPASTATDGWIAASWTDTDTEFAGATNGFMLGDDAGALNELSINGWTNWGNVMPNAGAMGLGSTVCDKVLMGWSGCLMLPSNVNRHAMIKTVSYNAGVAEFQKAFAANYAFKDFWNWKLKLAAGHLTVGVGTWSVGLRLSYRFSPVGVL